MAAFVNRYYHRISFPKSRTTELSRAIRTDSEVLNLYRLIILVSGHYNRSLGILGGSALSKLFFELEFRCSHHLQNIGWEGGYAAGGDRRNETRRALLHYGLVLGNWATRLYVFHGSTIAREERQSSVRAQGKTLRFESRK